jgi:hypothetical protein
VEDTGMAEAHKIAAADKRSFIFILRIYFSDVNSLNFLHDINSPS